jgi:hypothetical protein
MERDDIRRNEPAEEGKRNDPNVRDETAIQPGVSTISQSKTDDANQKVTRSGMENQQARPEKDNADPAFDEIGNKKDGAKG